MLLNILRDEERKKREELVAKLHFIVLVVVLLSGTNMDAVEFSGLKKEIK